MSRFAACMVFVWLFVLALNTYGNRGELKELRDTVYILESRIILLEDKVYER